MYIELTRADGHKFLLNTINDSRFENYKGRVFYRPPQRGGINRFELEETYEEVKDTLLHSGILSLQNGDQYNGDV